jgi:transcriptional regulator with XRE-family HTH domain
MTTRQQIGQQLRSIRKPLMGTKAFSKVCGLTEARIIDIERGRTNYTIDSLLKYLEHIRKEIEITEARQK